MEGETVIEAAIIQKGMDAILIQPQSSEKVGILLLEQCSHDDLWFNTTRTEL